MAAVCETSGIDSMWRYCEGFRAGVKFADETVTALVVYRENGWQDYRFAGSGRFGVLAYGGYALARESKAPLSTLRQMFELREQANNFAAAAKRFDKDSRQRIETTAFFGKEVNQALMNEVKTKMDAELRIPRKYFQAVSDGDVIWMRMETDVVSSNLLLHRVPYTDKKQLSKEGIKAIRDSIGRKYITTAEANTYMRINDVDLPMYVSARTINNNYVLEARGIWDIVNDLYGRPVHQLPDLQS